MILALDPGTTQTAWLIWDGQRAIEYGINPNIDILSILDAKRAYMGIENLVIEQVASYGMAVGAEVFETVFWYGRFAERWRRLGGTFELMPRKDVKMNLCNSNKARDSNIWQALVDRFGAVGTKKNPGLLYGIKSHERAALALAVTWWDLREQETDGK